MTRIGDMARSASAFLPGMPTVAMVLMSGLVSFGLVQLKQFIDDRRRRAAYHVDEGLEPLGDDHGETVAVGRLMLPDDANPAGNVHGGTILQMVEMAGYIIASKHCNPRSQASDPSFTPLTLVTARIEHMEFKDPVFVGDAVKVYGKVIFTSERSVLVAVSVQADNVQTGRSVITNTAMLWYVAYGGSRRVRPLMYAHIYAVSCANVCFFYCFVLFCVDFMIYLGHFSHVHFVIMYRFVSFLCPF